MAGSNSKDRLLAMIRDGKHMSLRQQFLLTAQLSMPAIMAQLSTIVMDYIDASMVGSLGANEEASVGLVATTWWLFTGISTAFVTGFSVQVAHKIGANKQVEARNIARQAITACLIYGLCFSAFGIGISSFLPVWLGGNADIAPLSSAYFFTLSSCLPILVIYLLVGGMLRWSGNMRIPSMLDILMCVLDVTFNFLLIFPTREIVVLGHSFVMPGAGLGVKGAALGSAMSIVIVCSMIVCYLVFRSNDLKLIKERGSFIPTKQCLMKAFNISLPIGIQQFVMSSAQIFITIIIAPLGNVSIAAHSLAITAESLCYMPGYGIADAATSVVGQSLGAGRRNLARRFAYISIFMGMTVMGVLAVLMFIASETMMSMMTNVQSVIDLGSSVLRIEAFAEPLFAVALVSYGAFVGAGDTRVPCWMNNLSMWAVRLTMAWTLINVFNMGLKGMWIAMAIELCFRGTIFFFRMSRGKWIKEENFNQ